jgi:hypothetical protein
MRRFQLPRGLTLLVVLAVSATNGSASAQSTGGMEVPDEPLVRRVACVATADVPCLETRALVRGGRLVITGQELGATTRVVFRGARSPRDDVTARAVAIDDQRVEAAVPVRARSGPMTVVSSLGRRTRAPRVRVVARARPVPVDAAPETSFFFDGRREPAFAFDVNRPGQATVELVRDHDGTVVRSWSVAAEPERTSTVRWDGLGPDGAVPSAGRYRFRLVDPDAVEARVASTATRDFSFYDHIFPIRGRHNLGYTDTNNFGGARNHKGQDMFASCGTPLAAARGGVVEFAGYHEAAGNYVVIDGAGTDVDYVYMHMLEPGSVRTGERVFTGQQIGEVGETGRATGCHLHFEMWSGPGWYAGGEPFDPLPALREWDAYS